MRNKWMSITAGILDIGHGIVGMYFGLFVILAHSYIYSHPHENYEIWGPIYTITGIMAIIGGIFMFKRKKWGLVLAGAISSCLFIVANFTTNILNKYSYWEPQDLIYIVPALVAIALTVLTKKQFKKQQISD